MQIFIGGDFVGGATELIQLLDDGKLKSKLKSASNRAFPDNIAKLVREHVASEKDSGPSAEEQKGKKLEEALEQKVQWTEQSVGCAAEMSAC